MRNNRVWDVPGAYANAVRMLASPMRRCMETGWALPRGPSPYLCHTFFRRLRTHTDLMVQFASALIPGEQRKMVFLPVGLEHRSIRPHRGGKNHYVFCWKSAVATLLKSGMLHPAQAVYMRARAMTPVFRDRFIPAVEARKCRQLEHFSLGGRTNWAWFAG